MPTKRRNKSAVKDDVDILDKVLDTASLPHSVDILSLKQEVEEQLRLLNIRAKKLGKGDSVESRKLVLLEHILRASFSVSLQTQTLASAVGMKAAAFENLSFHVAQYVDVSKSNKKKQSRVSSSSVASQQPEKAVRSSSNQDATSTIPALSIRLGSQVHDSHGFAQRAQQLFEDMEDYISSTSTISSHKKQGYLQDMRRSRATYEAACFYLVARGRKMKKSRSNDATQEEEEDVQLSIQDVVNASSSVSASEFRDVLPIVEKFASDMEARQEKDRKQPAASNTSKRKRGKSRKNGQSHVESNMGEAARALLVIGEAGATASDVMKRPRVDLVEETSPVFVYNPKFLEWRKEKLQEASNKIEQRIAWEQSAAMVSISAGDAMSQAADEVLRRHGLLVD